ncbi:hypothetical protein JCM8097_002372 [Rhodosporidiobolus ruineniae]
MDDPSPAVRLPAEILARIFEWLPLQFGHAVKEDTVSWAISSSCPALRQASLVCKNWRHPAQHQLVRSIQFKRLSQAKRFLRTLDDHPDLAKHARAICIGLQQDHEGRNSEEARVAISHAMVEYLERLPNVHSIRVRFLMESSRDRFVHICNNRHLRVLLLKTYELAHKHIGGACVMHPLDIYRAVCKPSMRVFEMSVHPRWKPEDVQLAPPPELSSPVISLSLTVNVPAATHHFLSLFGARLRYLSLYTEHQLSPVECAAAFRSLTGLRELRFESNIEADGSDPLDKGANLWFEDVFAPVRSPSVGGGNAGGSASVNGGSAGSTPSPAPTSPFPELRKLSLSDQAATPSVLRHLPPSLVTFEYIQRSATAERIFATLASLLAATPGVDLPESLEEVVVVSDEDQMGSVESDGVGATDEEAERVRRAFEERGVRFEARGEEADIPLRRFLELCLPSGGTTH